MPQYTFRAKDDTGKTVRGVMAADSEEALAAALDARGLYLIEAAEVRRGQVRASGGKVKRRELINFCIHLSTVLGAGVPIVAGLEDMIAQTTSPRFRLVLEDVLRSVQGGLSFSEALSRHPRTFAPVFVNICRAGEVSGTLDAVLQDMANFLEWQEELVSSVRQATMYPALVLSAVFILMLGLFTFVVPRFAGILLGLNVPLPLPTRLALAASRFTTNYFPFIVGGLVALIVGMRLFIRTGPGRHAWDRLKLNIPYFGELIRKVALSRFAHFFSVLYKSGVGIFQILEISEHVVGNVILARAVAQARERVRAGARIGEALAATGEFPPMVLRMIAVGEITGEMDRTLDRVTKYYDREVPATIKRVFTAMEPILILCLAAVVLGLALSLYLPLYDVISRLGRGAR
ncbi:MAG: type II secretion system F family protein [Deltaproteobacteria bacterium]|nr:type II secretion system F family protein [Deltaproteobacteria bacterium]